MSRGNEEPSISIDGLGSLSKRFESGGDSSAIGYDSKGGTSYGKYQIASKTGTMDKFLDYIKDKNPEAYNILSSAGDPNTGSKSGSFVDAWKNVIAQNLLGNAEHEFIKATHYDPAYEKLNPGAKSLVDKSSSLQNVLWSTAVQHGPSGGGRIFNKTYIEGMSETDYVNAIYQERSTKFGSSSAEVQQGVRDRFTEENQMALAAIGNPTPALTSGTQLASSQTRNVPAGVESSTGGAVQNNIIVASNESRNTTPNTLNASHAPILPDSTMPTQTTSDPYA
jgi:hypothetical protein